MLFTSVSFVVKFYYCLRGYSSLCSTLITYGIKKCLFNYVYERMNCELMEAVSSFSGHFTTPKAS